MSPYIAEALSPSAKKLIENRVASRIHVKDASLYSFSAEAQSCAEDYMGWTDLATNPPLSLNEIQSFVSTAIDGGLKHVVLIGQGGSTQAPMTITKYNKEDSSLVAFRTLDSDSPVRVRAMLAEIDIKKTIFIISSKSGGTLEPRLMLQAVRSEVAKEIEEKDIPQHLVAITDPGSELEHQAREEGWLKVFLGEPKVGGRFSALSVFGLLPAALVGIDLKELMDHARKSELRCSEDSLDNPAIELAAFLYEGYLEGRNKFSLFTQKRGRVFGLWVEQLVAESLGKEGKGILPNIEVDTLLVAKDPGDRSIITYLTKNDLWDEQCNFEKGLSYIDPSIPRRNYRIDSVEDLADHFVMWEYATAMCGYLMQVCPFDQPDVASAKKIVLDILKEGQPEPAFTQDFMDSVFMGTAEVRLSPCFSECTDIREAVRALLLSVRPGDFFSLNAFLPFTGEGRREALERIRHGVADTCGIVSCLEVGPRYLHSTGQIHKGGPNNGVFLILSADEIKDIPLEQGAESLGTLAKAQALGDLLALAARDRRCVHVHLPDNSGVTLRAFAETFVEVLYETERITKRKK